MKTPTRLLPSLLACAALAVSAGQALAGDLVQGKTRAEVKAELAEALRTGDIVAAGETGMKLNELYPERYATTDAAPGKTRAEVRAELDEAIRSGNIVAGGESGQKLNELHPERYATTRPAAGKTRAQVKAELAEAQRTGDIVAAGESGLKLNELFPGNYPKANVEPTVAEKPRSTDRAGS